jgi:glycosyltransferase involved in cell wall biosynthesis
MRPCPGSTNRQSLWCCQSLDTYQYSAGTTVALEAHAAGKAIVATNTPGMRDFVVDGVTGFLVPPGDAIAMRDAIAKLWNDPHLAAAMGLAGRAHVEREFNPAVVDARIRQAYADAAEEYRQSR